MICFPFQQVTKNYGRLLILISVILFVSLLYVLHESACWPYADRPDLCQLFKERLLGDKNDKNASRQWWEWACLQEKEWDKGLEFTCKDMRKVGNYQICFDAPFQPKIPCLVYSFGIDNDFRFDDAMGKFGCQVHSFDPSMKIESHKRSAHVHFHNMGLATEDSDDYMPLIDGYTMRSKKAWKIRKLSSIRKMLGHEKRAIDVLKIDIETYEWAIMRQLLDDGSLDTVRQLTIEWHIFPNEPMRTEFANMFDTYMRLKKKGFRQFYVDSYARYHSDKYFNSQADNSLINVLFTDKHDRSAL